MTAKHTQKIRAMDSGVLLTAYFRNRKCHFPRGLGTFRNWKCHFPRGLGIFRNWKCPIPRGLGTFRNRKCPAQLCWPPCPNLSVPISYHHTIPTITFMASNLTSPSLPHCLVWHLIGWIFCNTSDFICDLQLEPFRLYGVKSIVLCSPTLILAKGLFA